MRIFGAFFLHELGHGLGLNHPDTAGQHVVAVMNSIISDQEILSADDIAGGQSLYGAPAATTPTPTPGPGSPSHLANISTRMKVGVGEDVLIGGFIIQGTQTKKLILRAIGPSLAAGGVPNALADPVLELHDSSGAVIANNDDWSVGSQSGEVFATGLAPNDPQESAIIITLSPGSYTAVMKGYQNGQGVGLVEAYELDGNGTRLVNISTRGRVGLSDDAMIGGLIVQGSNAKRAIVRALGPSLPVAGALADPVLELHDSSGALLASNDNWDQQPAICRDCREYGAAAEHQGISHHRHLRGGELHRDCPWRRQHNRESLWWKYTTSTSEGSLTEKSPVMKLLRSLLPMLCVGLAVASVRATTVIPPTFDQLVSDAELIFQGTVTDTRSEWTGQGAERVIVTYVTFKIEDAIKGAPGGSYTIRMLGGTVDGETAEVADAPRFKAGDRDILFVEHNGNQFVPLVGIMHGRFHVQTDAGGTRNCRQGQWRCPRERQQTRPGRESRHYGSGTLRG